MKLSAGIFQLILLASLSTDAKGFTSPLGPNNERLSSSSCSRSELRASVIDAKEDEKFKDEIRELCSKRNMPLEKVKNCRDLASVQNSPIKPGRIFRTGRLGDATEKDQALLLNELKITTLVDLRSPTELKDDPALMADVFKNFTDILWLETRRGKKGCVKELDPGVSPIEKRRFKKTKQGEIEVVVVDEEEEFCDYVCDDPKAQPANAFLEMPPKRKERHFVSLMNEFKYVRGTVTKLRKRDLTRSLLKVPGAILSKRIWNSLKQPFLREINDGGLTMLNDLLLRFGAPGIKYVLDLCADKERHPIAFYCTAGKDRTGMITAIILSVCGAQPADIVEDYSLSANVYAEMNDHQAMVGALSQRSLDPKTFLGAPPQVMAETLMSIEEHYGSVEGYCDFIGFGRDQREKLKKALTED
jgi:protein tyrosine/serine phosphatase